MAKQRSYSTPAGPCCEPPVRSPRNSRSIRGPHPGSPRLSPWTDCADSWSEWLCCGPSARESTSLRGERAGGGARGRRRSAGPPRCACPPKRFWVGPTGGATPQFRCRRPHVAAASGPRAPGCDARVRRESPPSLIGFLFEHLAGLGARAGVTTTGQSLARLVAGLGRPVAGERVVDPACGEGQLLLCVARC